jgi:hypothetical protein
MERDEADLHAPSTKFKVMHHSLPQINANCFLPSAVVFIFIEGAMHPCSPPPPPCMVLREFRSLRS